MFVREHIEHVLDLAYTFLQRHAARLGHFNVSQRKLFCVLFQLTGEISNRIASSHMGTAMQRVQGSCQRIIDTRFVIINPAQELTDHLQVTTGLRVENLVQHRVHHAIDNKAVISCCKIDNLFFRRW